MRELVMHDEFLKAFFELGYSKLIEVASCPSEGIVLEIGAGSSIVKSIFPEAPVVTSDVVFDDALNVVCSGTSLPFKDSSLNGIIAKDALHHLPDLENFLSECQRTLKPGARAVFLEPYWGPVASFVFKFFHQEPFYRNQPGWRFAPSDPWDSNQALPWIILRRDKKKLRALVQSLEVEEHQTLFGIPLLLSGGVFNRSRVPSSILKKMLGVNSRSPKFARLFHFYILFSFKKKGV